MSPSSVVIVPHLYWAMIAVEMAGGVPVPLVPRRQCSEEMTYRAGALRCAVRDRGGDQEQVDKVIEAQETLHGISSI